ncbi:transglycosylase domain-containing protein [Chelativorans sp. AA-79]|uniref:transglycosylase domain-containing protein n=1 Tax=Chelativorans sp. AA-79 TaxID=3028735 RepID=UPI0023F78160|nr:transglycosylase domain-containing protein [Chelativorans sp. AA-79]WEX09323.1 transglycosylase domain-containing protein [Chelativorans sp. AA-79]
MAKATRKRRIEPTFGTPASRRAGTLSVTAADRVVPPQRRRKSKKKARRRPSRSRRGGGFAGFLKGVVYWSIVLGLWAGIAAVGLVAFYGAQMPSLTTWAIPDRPPNVKILAVDGSLIANRGMTGGEAIGLHEMSPYIPQAVIAIEDRRFYSHWGVDPIGLARAMAENVVQGELSQGGSTITQQLAKNLYLKPDRTIERKVQEMLLAIWLEQKYTKDQILEMYLNRVYFGSGAYGVESASQRYFNKSARDVTLSEAALLAGLLKAPSRLSPARDPQAAEGRAQVVLAAMRQEGMIGDSELTAAMSAPATRAAAFWTGSEHYVADRIMEELPALVGTVQQDLVVRTTIDLHLQRVAEKSIRRLIDEEGKKLRVSQGALVSIDGSGAVRAMVGGYDYANSQFDRASEARRQPGSAFKPFVYMAALEQGRTPLSVRNDAPVRIGRWRPENYRGKYYGQVTLAEALARSLNSVAAQLTMEVGPKAVVEVAHRMGIESDLNANASIALGTSEVTPLELTAAYVPFANGGFRPDVHFMQRVATASGKVLYEHNTGRVPRVASPEITGMMNSMMAGTIEYGSGRSAAFGWPAAGKTGTTQDSRDAWFVGYTSNLVTGVWFGNDDSRPTEATGSSMPAQAWREFMTAAHKGVPVAGLPGKWRPEPQTARPLQASNSAPQNAVGDDVRPEAIPSSAERGRIDGRPVPPADVGGPPQRRHLSILDVILGN